MKSFETWGMIQGQAVMVAYLAAKEVMKSDARLQYLESEDFVPNVFMGNSSQYEG